jgi:outer membrane immunogenic protein
MRKSLIVGVALVALVTGPAMAADLPVKAPRMVVADSFNWSRCYLGAHVGYGWGRNTNDFGNAVRSGPTEELGPAFDSEFGPFNHNTGGGVFGGQIGCNYQFAPNWLVGVEGEVWWSGMKGSFTAPEDVGDPGTFSRFESRNRWDADVALRLGYIWNRHLLYAKAGVAFGNFSYTQTHDDFPTTHSCPGVAFVNGAFINGQCSVSFTKTLPGLLLGAGWEYALSNSWSIKAEYNYINFASHNLPYPSAAATIQSFAVHDTKHIVKIGVNYLFGDSVVRAAY